MVTMAEQIGRAAGEFAAQQTGHAPESVDVVLGNGTVLVTLHGALSPAEKALSKTAAGASKVHEFHRQLFNSSSDPLLREIKRITGVAVRHAAAEVMANQGAAAQVFATGAIVQVFLLAGGVPTDAWAGGR